MVDKRICLKLHIHCGGCCSAAQSCPTLCDPMGCSMPGLPVPHHLPEFSQVHSHCIRTLSSCLSLWLSLLLLPSVQIRWPKYWSFSISPSSEYSGLISLKINWYDLLAVQGTFRNLLQHHSSKTSILLCSAFFTVQVSQVYMTIGKDYSLDYVDLC